MVKLMKIVGGIFIAIVTAAIIGGFRYVSDSTVKDELQDERILNNKEDCQKNAENVEYMQKTLNVTNNTVTEIKVKIENLPTKSDIEKLNMKLDGLHRKFDLTETYLTNE